jgi:CRISPR/Cas system-associated exonuclease Cas4 (RecB family)
MKLAATSYNWGSWLNRIKVNLASDKDRYKTRGGVVNYGNVMHSVMERIRRIEDVERSVNKAVFNGELKEIDKASIIDKIKSAIESDELTKSWFDGTMNRIFIEKTIIVEDHEYRPDRVMVNADKKAVVVDYKFGKRHSNKYVAQIRRYMQLLNDAGYDIECGYLWYFEENDIQKIEWNVE